MYTNGALTIKCEREGSCIQAAVSTLQLRSVASVSQRGCTFHCSACSTGCINYTATDMTWQQFKVWQDSNLLQL